MQFHHASVLGYLSPAIIALTLPLVVFFSQQQQKGEQHAANGGFPFVLRNKILDGNGNQVILRGAQIPSELNAHWSGGNSAKTVLNPTVFAAMHAWGMNTLRLPVAAYEYQLPGYMPFLDSVVQQANQAGLFVILANFEVSAAGGGNGVLDQQGLTMWQFMAQHYASNPMVMFDLINEPQNATYQDWLYGNSSGVVGMQQVVNAIRAAGGKQIIVAEAIDTGTTFFSGFTSFITDPNIVYSVHIYFKDATERSTSGWDTEFGNLAANYPVLVGEWALLPNAHYPSFCTGLDAITGAQLVHSFLTYMQQHQISWTAWEFKVPHLIKDTSFTPTVLTDPWCCGQGPICQAGMGTLMKNYLLTGTATTTPTETSTPTPNPQDTFFSLTVCPHGLGNCGDSVNPHGGGTQHPKHQTRTVTVSVSDIHNNPVGSPKKGSVIYVPAAGDFQGTVDMGSLPSGTYQVSFQTDGFLVQRVLNVPSIRASQTNTLPPVSLVNGDINNDNKLDILDYNMLAGCLVSTPPTSPCTALPTLLSAGADIADDDGRVDGVDYNLLIREMSTQQGQ